ncbi:DUF5107 domain-containing protein [Hamadaea tsunoensis]|uniref:DUF5107 domain-containing protein n=1 Tax=Hamadaea tsunoensis TaxID=53368 RepID=UPI0004036B37|nr:DUF5107 domain-containing protein [Hamadaea tsunoensis]
MTSTLRTGTLRIEAAADPVPGLPVLSGLSGGVDPAAGVDAEMRRNLAYGRPPTLLPYTRLGGYDRHRAERDLDVVVLENELLTATFLPGLGGRLWSLVHRPTGRELLFRNPVLQPANLALRDAWLAGGVEWNLGMTGHWPLTGEPLHAARVTAADGTPVLRMFEYERLRGVVLRIDAWLPAGSPVLLVTITLHNPSAQETPVYWWSNIAVPENAGTRVLAPAGHAFHFDYVSELRHIPFPERDGTDASYPGRAPRAADYFLDLPIGVRPWIAALDADGTGLVQLSTRRLRGRKLFCWGTGTGGRRWQEWLSGPGSAYLEIQAGLARTQMEHLPMPAGATWSWTEAYGMLETAAAEVHGPWPQAWPAAGRAVDALVPEPVLAAAEAFAAALPAPEALLYNGSGWGGLEIAAGALPASAAVPFPAPGPEQEPWRQLLARGVLPVCDPPATPVTGTHWRERLEASAGDWHALYHLGLLRLADDDDEGARDACKRSLGEAATPWPLRVLAHLAATADEAADLMAQAHRLRPGRRDLTVEALAALLRAGRAAAALDLIERLSTSDRAHGRIRLAEAQAAHALGDDDRVRRLLDEGIRVDDMREGEVSLDTLWLAVRPGTAVPPHYDFRMTERPSA